MWWSFHLVVDMTDRLPYLWKLNAPPGLKELLWKSLFQSLPIGSSWHSRQSVGLDFCPCGDPLPLTIHHVFASCSFFPVAPLYSRILFPALWNAASHKKHVSTDPNRWHNRWWFPLLSFQAVAKVEPDGPTRDALLRSVREREWIYGSFLWGLWKTRMKLAHEPDFILSIDQLSDRLTSSFSSPPLCPLAFP